MGTYIYLRQPILLPEISWPTADGKRIYQSSNLYKVFEKYVFVKDKVTTLSDFAYNLRTTEEKALAMIHEQNEERKEGGVLCPIAFPILDKEYYLSSKELVSMGSVGRHMVNDDFIELMQGSIWVSPKALSDFIKLAFEPEYSDALHGGIVNKFIEGKHFVEFY